MFFRPGAYPAGAPGVMTTSEPVIIRKACRGGHDARGRSEFFAGINSPRGRERVRVAAAGRRWNVGTNADDEELIAHRRAVKAPLQGAHRARGLKLGAAASE